MERLFCFRFNYRQLEETNAFVVTNVSYEQFCSYGKGFDVNWKSYKEQLEKGKSPNIEKYKDAKYIDVKFGDFVYFFGFGLSKELIAELVEDKRNPIKCLVIFKNGELKRIPASKAVNYADKSDHETIKNYLQKGLPFNPNDENNIMSFGCLENKDVMTVEIGYLVAIDRLEFVLKDKKTFAQYKAKCEASAKRAAKNLKQTGDANIKKLNPIEKILIKATLGILNAYISRLLGGKTVDEFLAEHDANSEDAEELKMALQLFNEFKEAISTGNVAKIHELNARVSEFTKEHKN